jgi:hypothetical protein
MEDPDRSAADQAGKPGDDALPLSHGDVLQDQRPVHEVELGCEPVESLDREQFDTLEPKRLAVPPRFREHRPGDVDTDHAFGPVCERDQEPAHLRSRSRASGGAEDRRQGDAAGPPSSPRSPPPPNRRTGNERPRRAQSCASPRGSRARSAGRRGRSAPIACLGWFGAPSGPPCTSVGVASGRWNA